MARIPSLESSLDSVVRNRHETKNLLGGGHNELTYTMMGGEKDKVV